MSEPVRPNQTKTQDDETIHPIAQALFGWVERPGIANLFFWGLAGVTLMLALADFLIHRHDYIALAEGRMFYAFFGFVSFSFVVLMGWPLGALLRRDENYYGDQPDDSKEEGQ